MKSAYKGLALLVFAVALQGCTTTSRSLTPAVNWDFVQSVGGLDIGRPYVDQDLLFIPVTVDFSGRRQITVQPTNTNSGKVCSWGEADVQVDFPFGLFNYDIELKFYAVDASQGPRSLPPGVSPGVSHPCEELVAPIRLPLFIGTAPPIVFLPPPNKVRLYYRDSLFVRHYLGEYSL